jgi:hypothetical protein
MDMGETWRKTHTVPRSNIARIREKLRQRQYDMSAHAMEDMAEGWILSTSNTRSYTGESPVLSELIRVAQIIEGVAADQHTAGGVVGRFTGTGRYLMITVYKIGDVAEER